MTQTGQSHPAIPAIVSCRLRVVLVIILIFSKNCINNTRMMGVRKYFPGVWGAEYMRRAEREMLHSENKK